MKKLITIILAVSVALMFSSCMSSSKTKKSKTEVERTSPSVPKLTKGSSETVHGEADCTGLTDSDMKALIKNYDAILDELEDYGADFTVDDYDSYDQDIEEILDSYGISGPNRYSKLIMAYYCEAVLAYDVEMKKDLTTALTMKALGMDPLAEFRAMTNDDDMAVVKANFKAFQKVVDAR